MHAIETISISPSTQLGEETDAFYALVRQAYERSDYFHDLPLNLFWGGENMTLLHGVIAGQQAPEEKLRTIIATDLYSHGSPDRETIERQIDWWLELLRNQYELFWQDVPQSVQESTFVPLVNQLSREGRVLSPDFLRHFTLSLEIEKHCRLGSGRLNILELGAGYGGFARIFKQLHPGASYVIVDIPETLYFSSLFLRFNFPNAKVHYVTQLPDSKLDVSEYDFVFVPSIFAEAVRGNRFDLFYNTCSLGEMKNAVIRYWMNFAQEQLDVRYFFGVNRYLNTIDPHLHAWRFDENEASIIFDADWRVVQWELEPPFSRCPYHETFATRNLEIIAERLPREQRNPGRNKRESERITAQLVKQDWVVYAGQDNSMRLRDNCLVHDLTKTGPLSKLWEAIRLAPSVDNISLMLIYLFKLRRERPFEEVFYYLALLKKLQDQGDETYSALPQDFPYYLLNPKGQTELWSLRQYAELIESGYKGYNLIRYRFDTYALAQSLGPTDLARMSPDTLREYAQKQQCFVGDSCEHVKQQIDDSGFRPTPELVEQNFHGYNLVRFEDKSYALSDGLGLIDLANTTSKTLELWQEAELAFVAASIQALKQRIDDSLAPAAPIEADELLGDEHRDYRIAEYRGILYAIPKHLGPVKMVNAGERNLPEILSSRTRGDLRRIIDRAVTEHPPTAPPRLVEQSYRGYNLFAFSSLFLAVEAKWPEIDLERVRTREHGPFFSGTDLQDLKRQIDESACGKQMDRAGHALLVCGSSSEQTKALLDQAGYRQVTLLLTDPTQDSFGLPALRYEPQSPGLLEKLRAAQFDVVIVPYGSELGAVAWEQFAGQFCRQLLAVYPDGSTRDYRQDHFNRILYNMAYLRSMFSKVPPLTGQRVLEVGCSDGLPCDIVARQRPASVVGVDMLDTVGLLYQNPLVTYRKLDATTLPFEDNSFDLVYSIATFEHVADPLAAFNEMKRVLRPGGYGYVQTAPFYYTPFGHHMFGYFADYPWIHVRLSKVEIAEYARQSGIAAKIESARGGSAENYIEAMINLHHVNGKLFHEYGVDEFGAQPDVEIVSFQRTYEGENLVTPEILAEVKPVQREDLITHGFELVFRVK